MSPTDAIASTSHAELSTNHLPILEKRGDQYLVRPEGVNPRTGSSWNATWMPKGDVPRKWAHTWVESTRSDEHDDKRVKLFKDDGESAPRAVVGTDAGCEPSRRRGAEGVAASTADPRVKAKASFAGGSAEGARVAPPASVPIPPPAPVPTPEVPPLIPLPADVTFDGTKLIIPRWTSVQHKTILARHKQDWLMFTNVERFEVFLVAEDDLLLGEQMATAGVFSLVAVMGRLRHLHLINMSERPYLSDRPFYKPLQKVLRNLVSFDSSSSDAKGGLDHIFPYFRHFKSLSYNPYDVSVSTINPNLVSLQKLALYSQHYISTTFDTTNVGGDALTSANVAELLPLKIGGSLKISSSNLIKLREHLIATGRRLFLPPRLYVIINTDLGHVTHFNQIFPKSDATQIRLHFTSSYQSSVLSPHDYFQGLPDTLKALDWNVPAYRWAGDLHLEDLEYLLHMRTWSSPRVPNLTRVALHVSCASLSATSTETPPVSPALLACQLALREENIELVCVYDDVQYT